MNPISNALLEKWPRKCVWSKHTVLISWPSTVAMVKATANLHCQIFYANTLVWLHLCRVNRPGVKPGQVTLITATGPEQGALFGRGDDGCVLLLSVILCPVTSDTCVVSHLMKDVTKELECAKEGWRFNVKLTLWLSLPIDMMPPRQTDIAALTTPSVLDHD